MTPEEMEQLIKQQQEAIDQLKQSQSTTDKFNKNLELNNKLMAEMLEKNALQPKRKLKL